jgi:uncharacterized protein (TIGR02757 family)
MTSGFGHTSFNDMKSFLDEKACAFNTTSFIDDDPISVPHLFTTKQDIEVAAFLTATISWGNRKSIIKSANRMMDLFDRKPFDFISGASERELKSLSGFVHRTFNGEDLKSFVKCLRHIYRIHSGMESLFAESMFKLGSSAPAINHFREIFFSVRHPQRTQKHLSDPMSGSAAKRINMFLRWMVRNDQHGVDFGIWQTISPAVLSIPLDVHSGNVARKLGLLTRTQNDQKAVAELDAVLRRFDPNDPVKYDFALFGLGAIEAF